MENDRKNRTRRLIQLGALAEKYLHCEGASPEGFEERLNQLIAAQDRERAAMGWADLFYENCPLTASSRAMRDGYCKWRGLHEARTREAFPDGQE